jgi:hypothetical protein
MQLWLGKTTFAKILLILGIEDLKSLKLRVEAFENA